MLLLNALGSSFTIAAWINPSAKPAVNNISPAVGFTTGAGKWSGLWYAGANGGTSAPFQLNVYKSTGNTSFSTVTTASYPHNQWYYVVGVVDSVAKTLSIYVDGKLAGTPFTYTGTLQVPDTVNLARLPGNAIYFNGTLDDVSIWNTNLTAGDVSTLYTRQHSKYSGALTSRVMDAWAIGQSWTSFSWIPTLPFLKALPDYASAAVQNESSTDYSALVGSSGTTGNNDLMTGIAGLWHFNETSGTTFADTSGNAITGTVSGSASLGDQGLFGKAVNLATGAIINLGNNFSYIGTAAHTFSFWTRNTVGFTNLLAKRSGGAGTYEGWILFQSGGGDVCVERERTGTQYSLCTTGVSINDGKWHYVTYTYDGSMMKLYIDGLLNASMANSISIVSSGIYAEVGTAGSGVTYDEMAIWSRALHPSEVKQLYLRGANRVKHQVRVCTASNCSDDATGANWKGPDGTNQTYFSELNNNTVPLAMTGDVKKTLPSLLFSNFTNPVGTSRYFQYRAILESDDAGTACNYGSGATWCSPELKSVTVDPVHYDSGSPTISSVSGTAFSNLSDWSETIGSGGCAGGVGYNLSLNNTNWYWWDTTANSGAGGWVLADGTVAMSSGATTVSAQAGKFRTQVGTGTISMKAFLKSSGSAVCELDQVEVKGLQ